MSSRPRAARFDAVSLAVALLLVASPALAGPIIVGSLVFQNTIPAGPAGPGTNAFWLYWSPTLLPLSDVSLTVTGTNAQGQSVGGTWATTGAFDPNVALGGQAFPTNATITSATVTGSAANGQVDWASQRYQIAAQGVAATLTNASGLVPFPFGPDGTGDATPVMVTPTPRHYYLAEGATVWTFDTQIAMANRGTADAPVTVTFLMEDGTTVQTTLTVAAGARATLRAADVPGMLFKSFSTDVTSDQGVPLSVERTMTWDGGHGAHAGLASEVLSPVWYFAEGVQSWLDTYVLVVNPGDVAADVTITFFLNAGGPVVRVLNVGPRSRATVWTGSIPELNWRSFGMMLTSTQPVVSERAVYFGTAQRWDGGTLAMGVTAPSSEWYFGEGVLGTIFDEYPAAEQPERDADHGDGGLPARDGAEGDADVSGGGAGAADDSGDGGTAGDSRAERPGDAGDEPGADRGRAGDVPAERVGELVRRTCQPRLHDARHGLGGGGLRGGELRGDR